MHHVGFMMLNLPRNQGMIEVPFNLDGLTNTEDRDIILRNMGRDCSVPPASA